MNQTTGLVVSDTLNLKSGAGNSKSIFYAINEFEKRGIATRAVSAKNIIHFGKGLKSLIRSKAKNKFIIFNSLGSIMPKNKYWILYFFLSRIMGFKCYIIWYETADYFQKHINNHRLWLKFSFWLLKGNHVNHIIASKAAQSTIDMFFPAKEGNLIYNCAKINLSADPDENCFKNPTVINIGSVQNRKGYDLFVKTAIKSCLVYPTLNFYWIGPIHDREIFLYGEKLISEASLGGRIKWLGKMDYPETILSKSHLLFLSSRFDTMPLTMIEALALGKEIISFHSGGAQEVLSEEMLIENFDIDKASTKIIGYIKSNEGEKTRKDLISLYHKNFTPSVFVDNFMKLFNREIKDAN